MTTQITPTTAPVVHASHPVLAVDPDTDVITALTVMRNERVRHLPLVRGARCEGVVTETDLLRALTVSATVPPPAVGTLSHRVLPTVPEGATLTTIAATIIAGGLDAALVVADGVLVGIVTSCDVLAAVAQR